VERKYKILFKYPSRSRRGRFLDGLDSILNNIHDQDNFQILVTADFDDTDMRDLPKYVTDHPKIRVQYGTSESKIHAVNRDMEFADSDWDIVVVVSDDILFQFGGFDEVIRGDYGRYGLDTLLHYPDNDAKDMLAVLYIAGRTFYDRFGFIYDPRFKSLWCDNLIMEQAQKLGKYQYVNMPGMFVHLNPAYGHLERDELFNTQQAFWDEDYQMYCSIRDNGYELEKIKQ